MASVQTHTYKTLPSGLQILLDIYTLTTPTPYSLRDTTPTLLFFHAGGLVSYNRKSISPHLVQAALKREWTFVSADYRLLPQASGQELWEDMKDAYKFVVEKLPSILHCSSASRGGEVARRARRVVVGGASAGGYLAFLAASRFEELTPPPLAILGYYPIPSFNHPFFSKSQIFGSNQIKREEIEDLLDDETVLTGTDDGGPPFNVESLNEDLSRNTDFIPPKEPKVRVERERGRPDLYDWLVQENSYPKIFGKVERGFESGKSLFPHTVVLHAKDDLDVPFEVSRDFVEEVGEKARLVRVEGSEHSFDTGLFWENEGEVMQKVKEAWELLDGVMERFYKVNPYAERV